MKKIVHFLSMIAILSLSCNFATGLFAEPGLVEATGPILGMTVAASLDDQDRPVDPAFTYPADQPQMVVLVRLGDVAPGALTFNWYRVTGTGDEALFEQTVAVEAWDVAFSTGLNPGTLAAGAYKVVATFAGGSETIAWDVVELQTSNSTVPAGTSGSAAGGAPTPGPSGTRPPDVIVSIPGDPGQGVSLTAKITDANRADHVEFLVTSAWKDGKGNEIDSPVTFFVQVRVGITGSAPDESRDFTHPAGSGQIKKPYFQDPCKLPNGSDLPGTSITISAVTGGSQSQQGLQSATAVLGADTSRPDVKLVPEPANGAKVKPGDKIELTAIAEELRSGGSWQTGVSKIEIYVMEPAALGAELLKKEYNDYKDKSCDDKSWKQTTEKITYEVPAGVEGDIRICAFGYDFAGNIGKKCNTYHTGDPLKGALNSTSTESSGTVGSATGSQTSVTQTDADLSLSLAPGGTLSGTAQITYSFHEEGTNNTCSMLSDSIGPVEFTLPVTGTWTQDAIDFKFMAEAPIMVPYPATTCDGTFTTQTDVTRQVTGYEYHAVRDGQAYTADETFDCGNAAGPCERHWTIHLAPPTPGVGFRPGTRGVATTFPFQGWLSRRA